MEARLVSCETTIRAVVKYYKLRNPSLEPLDTPELLASKFRLPNLDGDIKNYLLASVGNDERPVLSLVLDAHEGLEPVDSYSHYLASRTAQDASHAGILGTWPLPPAVSQDIALSQKYNGVRSNLQRYRTVLHQLEKATHGLKDCFASDRFSLLTVIRKQYLTCKADRLPSAYMSTSQRTLQLLAQVEGSTLEGAPMGELW